MNVVAVVAVSVLGASSVALGLTWHEIHQGLLTEGSPFNDCSRETVPYPSAEEGTHAGLYRVRVVNEAGAPIDAEVCMFDADGVQRLHRTVVVAAANEWIVELRVPVGTFAHSIHGDLVDGVGGGGGATGADLGWCFSRAVEFANRIRSNGFLGEDVRCVDNKMESREDEERQAAGLGAFVGPPGGSAAGWAAGGLAVAGVGILAWAHWPRIKPFVLALFTRLERPRILDHRVRQEIRELVASDPGIHARAIMTALDLAEGQTRYHLNVLVREKVLSSMGTNYFVHGKYSPNQMRVVLALRNPSLERLLNLVRANPELTIGELAQRLQHSHSSVSKLARELEHIGLVETRKTGRTVRLVAARAAPA